MKCYYLAKDLNNCLAMMDLLLKFGEEGDDDERPYSRQQLKFDKDCLESLKRSSQGSSGCLQESLTMFEHQISA
jgi:hypothetical protein